ncbi:MAG: hypothetical protein JXO22_14420 [Phycisphaerae bacterium]|nr:hypothetical protein [Phycisphaerae bacterium]
MSLMLKLVSVAASIALGVAVIGSLTLVTGCPTTVPSTTGDGTTDGGTTDGGTTDGSTDGGTTDGGTTDPNDGSSTDSGDSIDSGTSGGDDSSPTGSGSGDDIGATDTPAATGNTGSGTSDGGTSDGSTSGSDDNTPPDDRPISVSVQQIVAAGDSVPGQSSSARFTYFGTPIVGADGYVAFWAGYSGGLGDAGLYVWNGTNVLRVLDDNPNNTGVVPSGESTQYFGDMKINENDGEMPMAWGSGGRLLFVSRVRNPQTRGIFRWRVSDGDMIRVVDMESHVQNYNDANTSAFACDFYQPGVSDNGLVPYVIEYTYVTLSNTFVVDKLGCYVSNGVTHTLIADSNAARITRVPDLPTAAKFTSIGTLTTLTPDGDVILQGIYSYEGEGSGVYLYTGGSLVRVVDSREGRSFPGIPSGAVVNSAAGAYDGIAIGPNLRIAVDTTLTISGSTHDTVLYYGDGSWSELSGGGNIATALLSGINSVGQTVVLAGGLPYITGNGASVNLASNPPSELAGVSWSDYGASLNNNGRALLRFGGSQPGLAFWTGGQLLFVDDAADILVPEYPEMDRPGRSGALSDYDVMTWRATDGGAQAIYVGTAQQ